MSDYRHAAIFQDVTCVAGVDDGWWLHIVPETPDDRDATPLDAVMHGPFASPAEAREFADGNYQNTGFVIPVLGIVEDEDGSLIKLEREVSHA
jgi:hypothetical protein